MSVSESTAIFKADLEEAMKALCIKSVLIDRFKCSNKDPNSFHEAKKILLQEESQLQVLIGQILRLDAIGNPSRIAGW